MKALAILTLLGIVLSPWEALGKSQAYLTGGSTEIKRALNIKGQTRTLAMMLVLKNDKDKIKFVKVRENYKKEIKSQVY